MCNDLLVIYLWWPFLILYEILSIRWGNYLYPALFLESRSVQMTLLINYQSCTFLFSDTSLVSSTYFMYGQTGILEFFIPSIELGPCAQLLKSPVGFFPLIYVFKLFLYWLPPNIQITIKGPHSRLGPLTFGASETFRNVSVLIKLSLSTILYLLFCSLRNYNKTQPGR